MVAINKALLAPDEFVLRMTYEDKSGKITERLVSPIRFIDRTSILALCLCRETPRRFELGRCSGIQLVDANDVLMPAEIRVIHEPHAPEASDSSRPE